MNKVSNDRLEYLLTFYPEVCWIVKRDLKSGKNWPIDLDIGTLTGDVENYPVGSTSIQITESEYETMLSAKRYYETEPSK